MPKIPWSGDRERDRGERAGVVIEHNERVPEESK